MKNLNETFNIYFRTKYYSNKKNLKVYHYLKNNKAAYTLSISINEL